MATDKHIMHLRRLRVLQALSRATPDPVGQSLILQAVQTDPELSPTIERVQSSLTYLARVGFVDVITIDGSYWMAGRITEAGHAWLNADVQDDQLEIYHPATLPAPAPVEKRGRLSTVVTLPPEVKAWLDQELMRRNFTGYIELSDLLEEQGYEISKSAVGRYGKRFKEEQKQLKQTIEMARAISEVYGDDGADMNQAITALMQQEVMAIIRDKTYSEEIKLPQLIQGVAQLNKSSLATIKFQIEQKARKQALDDAAELFTPEAAAQQGLNAEQAQFWREQVLGVK
ncbi:DUF3486 family protein [Sulfuriflexus mobilis]|uniref:DUF3486 family protein n=1 Tax=Sulfuriflexus mobilis TaxID=1811807 RepID=UPI000F84A6A6|nr:DUF3486 family protein [Sulfuriflexus mobilis]